MFGKRFPKAPNAERLQQVLNMGRNTLQDGYVAAQSRAKNLRTHDRTGSWQRAVLQLDEDYRIDAIVIDHSKTGARVRFRSHESLPASLLVKIGSLRINRQARVVWQSRGDAGLSYI